MSLARLVREREERRARGAVQCIRSPALQRLRYDLSHLDGIASAVSIPSDNPYEVQVIVRPSSGYWASNGNSDHASYVFLFEFSEKYPYEGPKVRYTGPRPLLHPNIEGEQDRTSWGVCLGLQLEWRPTYSLRDLVIGLEQLFVCPNADDPLPGVARRAAELMRSEPHRFAELVQRWSRGEAI